MRAVKVISTAAEALKLAIQANKPRPSADEVCERVQAYAENGMKSVIYPHRLPEATVEALRLRGFDVIVGRSLHSTHIDWSKGKGFSMDAARNGEASTDERTGEAPASDPRGVPVDV
jgi:hypothetical protein